MPPRIAIYTHDTFGLGHVRRCSRIARAVSQASPESAILLITGSPSAEILRQLPPNSDYVKIPTIVNKVDFTNAPSHLPIERSETTRLRAALTRKAIQAFRPELLLVDNFPLGSRRELLNVLRAAKVQGVRCVLGLRDILDSPEKVTKDWSNQGMYELLDELYDEIVVYGSSNVLDIASAYAMPPRLANKVSYCGFVSEAPAGDGEIEPLADGPFVLGTVGGGGDGVPLLESLFGCSRLLSEHQFVLVTGPLMDKASVERLTALAASSPNVRLVPFVENLPHLMKTASVVVSMAGYNTVSEILAVQANSVLVPRTWSYGEFQNREHAEPEWEQYMRAQGLAKMGLARMVEPNDAVAPVLAHAIREALASPINKHASLDLDGANAVAMHLLDAVTIASEARRQSA